MSAPTTDSAAIRQVLRALAVANYEPVLVDYGGGDYWGGEQARVRGASVDEVLAAITAVDDCYLVVRSTEGPSEHWVRFVMGNDPEEVVADYTTSLSWVLDDLIDGWMS